MGTEILSQNGKFSQRRTNNSLQRGVDDEAESQDVEGKVKTKLKSMWNNMKYGWTVKIKTNFSKDSPVWLLGKCYHRKQDSASTIGPFEEPVTAEDSGIEGFKVDFVSRIWLTYRREFPILNGSNFTTDCGWGCMLRSGQMLLAEALWRWHESKNPCSSEWLFREDSQHRKIIKWFGDNPSEISPFSIHSLVALGEATGKKAGDWYGPASVAHLLRQAVEKAAEDSPEFKELVVYVSQDCAVYIQDIIDQCEVVQDITVPEEPCTFVEEHESQMGTSWIDVNLVRRSVTSKKSSTRKLTWKSVILLVPVRLGAEKLNTIYGPCLTGLLTLDNCIGIIGGRPNHSLYFVGYQDEKLIHLDPHYCQERVDVWKPNFPLESFHCRSPRKMSLHRMDPSCCIGFYCKTRDEFDNFVKAVQPLLVPPQQKSEYPMFVFCDGRSKDALSFHAFSIPDGPVRRSEIDTDDDLESEEFEIL
ncbi:hypothetical protein B566_EDAN007626 [Ephemera danica]|nr:hypothetical protein B566_EDAN007626 [Ephemera danica]